MQRKFLTVRETQTGPKGTPSLKWGHDSPLSPLALFVSRLSPLMSRRYFGSFLQYVNYYVTMIEHTILIIITTTIIIMPGHWADTRDWQTHYHSYSSRGHQRNNLLIPASFHSSSTGECGLLPEHHNTMITEWGAVATILHCLLQYFRLLAICWWA